MTSPPPETTRAWRDQMLEEAGRRLDMVIEAGALAPQISWTEGDLTITAKLHGEGVDFSVTRANGSSAIGMITVPRGWTAAA